MFRLRLKRVTEVDRSYNEEKERSPERMEGRTQPDSQTKQDGERGKKRESKWRWEESERECELQGAQR